MGSVDENSEQDFLEAQLLTDPVESSEGTRILQAAVFSDFERRFLDYETLQWILISLLLIPAWGVGVLLLLYTPVRRYIMQKDFRSRKMYVTPDAIVYKVSRPTFLPVLGSSEIDKSILLPHITDIVLEQGCLQSLFGLHSLRIETLGQGPLDPYGVSVCGMTNPRQFRKVVLMAATTVRKDGLLPARSSDQETNVALGLSKFHGLSGSPSRSLSSPPPSVKDIPHQFFSPYHTEAYDRHSSPSGELVLRKLEDIKIHAEKIEALIMKQQGHTAEILSDGSEREC